MLNQLKRALVESYVGAIALGYLLAQVILHFVSIFASPVAYSLQRREIGGMGSVVVSTQGITFQDALPELIRFVLLLVLWYVLLRWLYFKPLKDEPSQSTPGPEPSA
jgi:hypothetical protein